MTTPNKLKFAFSISAAAIIHIGALAYTSKPTDHPKILNNGFSVSFGSMAAADSAAEHSATVPTSSTAPPPAPNRAAPTKKTALATPAAPRAETPPRSPPVPTPVTKPLETRDTAQESGLAIPRSDPAATHPGETGIAPAATAHTAPPDADAATQANGPGQNDLGDTKASEDQNGATDDGQSTAASTPSQNTEAADYAATVMAHLSRLRRPRAASPGSAFVSFRISKSGAIQEVFIRESSGARRFDRDAIKFVRKAAPFPAPPPGLDQEFIVEIKGR